jgi:nitrate/nitrite-specific signal transduction histidine kinase
MDGNMLKAKEFLETFKKGTEFIEKLLKDNERLRLRIKELEEEKKALNKSTKDRENIMSLKKKIEEMEREKDDLLTRCKELEEESKEFANKYVELEEENNNLANLYIASYQLHSTLDIKEVLQIILEIIINLIGGEEFAILLLDEKSNELTPVATEGIDKNKIPSIKLGVGIIGNVAKSGESYFKDEIGNADTKINPLNPIVCIPLKIKEHVIGVIAIYKLFIQKTKFVDIDYELFTLLAGHAATAIFGSKLYTESERKLSTIQGFIDLLTK